jgi:hypothetical protein
LADDEAAVAQAPNPNLVFNQIHDMDAYCRANHGRGLPELIAGLIKTSYGIDATPRTVQATQDAKGKTATVKETIGA